AKEDRKRSQPVAGRAQNDVPRSSGGEHSGQLRALYLRSGRKAAPQSFAPRVRAHLSPGLRVDEPEDTGVRQLLLAWIPDLDRDDVVSSRELEERTPPVERPAKVADHDHDRALACERSGPSERLTQRGPADPTLFPFPAQGAQEPDEAYPSLLRRQRPRIGVAEGDVAEPIPAVRGDVTYRVRDDLRTVVPATCTL